MPQTAAELLVDKLIAWNVDTVFGLPGDAINGLMEALRKRKDQIRFVGVRHEATAGFAATAYAKFSGRLGVCVATSGPGATNLLTGLYDAKFDQVPVLAITGMQFHDMLGTMYQQDVDTPRLFEDVAVYSERIMGPAHVDSIADVAIRMAIAKRGVAHLGFPADFQEKTLEDDSYGHMNQPRHTSSDLRFPRVLPREEDLRAAAEVLNAGERIVIVCGSGARGARAELLQVAEALGAPIAKPYLGLDVLPDDHPHVTGTMGVWETPATAQAFAECDTVLLVGTSFPYISFLPSTTEGKRGVQIDLAPERIGLRYPVEVGLVADAREALAMLLPLLRRKENRAYLEGVQTTLREYQARQEEANQSQDGPLKGAAFAAALDRHLADDAIVCGDSGQNTSWMARNIRARGARRISGSGTLASMASAVPYAIGAACAFPDRPVVAFVGDGGLSMLMGELATLARYRLPVKVFVAKNHALNMIRWEQMMFQGNPEYGIEISDIDFAKVAEGCGCAGLKVTGPQDVDAVVQQALAMDGPVVVEAMVDPLEPMMSGKLRPQTAQHMAEALAGDQPHRDQIEREFRQAAEQIDPANLPIADAALGKANLL
jgi:thiamine pyrophosphate-dependent acetolactate synthase large subunit-like protein